MSSQLLAHEVVRVCSQKMSMYSCPPRGDWGWLPREVGDLGVRFVRRLMEIYHRGGEDRETFMKTAMHLVRLLFELAFTRTLVNSEDQPVERRAGLCTLMMSVKDWGKNISFLGGLGCPLGVLRGFCGV